MRRTSAALVVLFAATLIVAVRSVPGGAVVPGTNGLIAFDSNRSGDSEIYSANNDGSSPSAITSNAVDDLDPAWSPDGTRIAFVRKSTAPPCTAVFPCGALWVMDADGTNETQLTDYGSTVQVGSPSWSPDGVWIAYQKGTSSAHKNIYKVKADGSTVTPVTLADSPEPADDMSPDWSSTGTIAFMSDRDDSTFDLYTMDGNGGAETKITLSGSGTMPQWQIKDPAWSPDGTQIAFGGSHTSGYNDDVNLYIADADGSGTHVVYAPSGNNVYNPAWSPNGTRLLVTTLAGSDYVVKRLDTAGGNVTIVASSSGEDANGTWGTAQGSSTTTPPASTTTTSPPPTTTTTTTTTPPPTTSSSTAPPSTTASSPPTTTSTSTPPTTTSSSPPASTASSSPPTSTTSSSPPATTTSTSTPPPSSSSPPPVPPNGVHLDVGDNYFDPSFPSVGRGQALVFFYDTAEISHTATDDSGLDLYDSGVVPPGGDPTWYTFTAAGQYRFTCTLHEETMNGIARVPVRAAPATGKRTRTFTITWASAVAADPYVYDVRIKPPGRSWRRWRTGITGRTAGFHPHAGPGRYRFKARLREPGAASSMWSVPATIKVT